MVPSVAFVACVPLACPVWVPAAVDEAKGCALLEVEPSDVSTSSPLPRLVEAASATPAGTKILVRSLT